MATKIDEAYWREKLIERSTLVGLDYHVVSLIRQKYWDSKGEATVTQIIIDLENNLKTHKKGRKFELYTETLKVLKSLTYPQFEEVVKKYED